MKYCSPITALLVFCVPAGAATALPMHERQHEQPYMSQYENVLGTSLDLKIFAGTAADADKAETAVLAEIDREAGILSSWDKNSEFSRWFRTQGTAVPVSTELLRVLSLFDMWRESTGGALDAAAEAAIQVWKAAAAQNRRPTQTELDAAARQIRETHWRLDAVHCTATHLTKTPIGLNSFTKSFIMDRAVKAAFAAAPISGVVINIGGDIVVRGSHEERVEIVDPRSDAENGPRLAAIHVRNLAIATSGSYRRGVNILGQHFSHIVDPRTGEAAGEVTSSTVVAPDPATAGALATAFSVMTPEESQALALQLGNVEYLILMQDGRRITSGGWHSLEAQGRTLMAAAKPESAGDFEMASDTSGTWNPGMELLINVEVAQIDTPRVHRPYVAVWIEDQDKFPVRTVALWTQKPKYIPDLKAWYHDEQTRSTVDGADLAATVASATRAAGKYTVKWDGKDNKGKPVKAGKYTVCIEAAREHGTYQIIRQEMDFSSAPKQINLPGNTELSSASLDYRKTN